MDTDSRGLAACRSRRAVAVATMLVLAAGAVSAEATTRHVSGPSRERLNDVLPMLGDLVDGGRVRAELPMQVTVVFRHDSAALARLEAAQNDPASQQYRHWLTPAQFEAAFDVPSVALRTVQRYVTARGLHLVDRGSVGDLVVAAGTAGQVERTFDVTIHTFRDGAGRSMYANTAGALVPAGVGIDGVLGLNDLVRVAPPLAAAPAPAAQGQCDPTGVYCTGMLGPRELWKAYQQPGAEANPTDNHTVAFGQGVTVGIIGEGRSDDVIGALREFERTRQLPRVPVKTVHSGAGPWTDDSGRVEWELDSQAITGMAPDIKQLRLYFTSDLVLGSIAGAVQKWASDRSGAQIVNASLGICEDFPGGDVVLGPFQQAIEHALAQAAAEGRSFFSSTGDTGSGCLLLFSVNVPPLPPAPSPPVNGVLYGEFPFASYPAASPNAVAVGGTILYSAPTGERTFERAWDHTGGEPSEFIPQPSFQYGVDLLTHSTCTTQPDGTPYSGTPPACRGIADVAAEAGDITVVVDHKLRTYAGANDSFQANGYDMVDDCPANEPPGTTSTGCAYNAPAGTMTDHFSEGGTSLSSPLWAGMWARVLSASRSLLLGPANYLIYRIANRHDGAFYDIPAGSTNGAYPTISYSPGQTSGYDFPTGWGSPNVARLITDVDGQLKPRNG